MFGRKLLRVAAALPFVLLASPCAHAQLFRAYVASDGSDANPCTLAAPCRLLPAALTAVASGGEIWMLDSANYNTGTVTIAKSVTILAIPGAVGSVVAIAGPAVSITTPGLKVALRNLVIVPVAGGGGTDGVRLWGASALSIEGCVFANLPGKGVDVLGDGASVRIGTSIFRNIAATAVYVENGGTADVHASQFIESVNGSVRVISTSPASAKASVSDSNFAGGGFGVDTYATVAGGGSARVAVTRSTFSSLGFAFTASNASGAPSSISVSETLVSGVGTAYSQGGSAIIYSLGNNHFFNSGTGTGTLTLIPPN